MSLRPDCTPTHRHSYLRGREKYRSYKAQEKFPLFPTFSVSFLTEEHKFYSSVTYQFAPLQISQGIVYMMGKRGKKRKFSDTWATLTQLGSMFNLSAKEIGQKLNELELRTYSIDQHKYIPTQDAIDNGFCTSTPLKHGIPFYMWQREKDRSTPPGKISPRAAEQCRY